MFTITRRGVENEVKRDRRYEYECPRCGKLLRQYPALSRYADVKICSACGTEEALIDWVNKDYEEDFLSWNLGRKNYMWYGIPEILFIYHNEWVDPEIEYKGYVLNVHDIEDEMWYWFEEFCDSSDGKQLGMRHSNYDDFAWFMKTNEDDVKELFMEVIEAGKAKRV